MRSAIVAWCLIFTAGCTSAPRRESASAPLRPVDLVACLYSPQMTLFGGDFVNRQKFANADGVPVFKRVRNVEQKTDAAGCEVLVELGVGSGAILPGVSNKSASVYLVQGEKKIPLAVFEATSPDLFPGTDATPKKLGRQVREAFKSGSPLMADLAAKRGAHAVRRAAQRQAAARALEPSDLALAAEAAADSALGAGDAQAAFDRYRTALAETDGFPGARRRLIDKTAAAAARLPELPAVPEEARRRIARGRARLGSAETDGFGPVVEELEQAVFLAPWSPEAHYNLALAQEGAGRFAEAIAGLKAFRLLAAGSAEAEAAQEKIYELEVSAENAARVQGLGGEWTSQHGTRYRVAMDGETLRATPLDPDIAPDIRHRENKGRYWTGGYRANGRRISEQDLPRDHGFTIVGSITGAAFAGVVNLPPYTLATCGGDVYNCYRCQTGAEAAKASGKLAQGALTLTFHRSRFEAKSRVVDFFTSKEECVSVRLLDKVEETLTLTRR